MSITKHDLMDEAPKNGFRKAVLLTEVDFRKYRLGSILKVVESSIYCYIVQRTIDEVDT